VVTPVIAPIAPSYATYTPYITAADFLAEPTGVDTSQLIPAGSSLTEAQALARLVANASSEADRICQKVLAATLDVESRTYRVQRDGTIHVPLPFGPVIMITSVVAGFTANTMTALADLSGIRFEGNVALIPVQCPPPLSFQFSPNPAAYARPGRIFADVTYVNGWAHSTLSASTLANAQSITPKSVVGFVPGLPFTVYDGVNTEAAQVAPTYVVGAATVPLVSPLANAHAAGITVSALPPFVRQSVIALAKWLAKTKGTKAIAMPSISGRTVNTSRAKPQKTEPDGDEDYQQAVRDLLTLKRSR
jgi:hypothetical protein